MRHLSALAAATAVVVLLAGCGIPTGAPQAVPANQVPTDLTSPNPVTTSTDLPTGGLPFYIYLFDSQGSLSRYRRVLSVHAPGLTAIVEYLVAGPSSLEIAAGVETYIPTNTQVLSVTGPSGGVVTVDFDSALLTVTGSAQIEAVEQVVYTVATATANPSTGVLFEVTGEPIEVPTGNGAETPSPVTTADYPMSATGTTGITAVSVPPP